MMQKKQYRVVCQQLSKLEGNKPVIAMTTVEAADVVVQDGVALFYQDINGELTLTWALPQGLWMEIELVGVEDGGEMPDDLVAGMAGDPLPSTSRPGPA